MRLVKKTKVDHKSNRYDLEIKDNNNFYANDILVHNSQINVIRDEEMNLVLSSKGIIKRGLLIEENETNMYWKAVHNTNLKEILDTAFPGIFVQVMGEAGPCQAGFD